MPMLPSSILVQQQVGAQLWQLASMLYNSKCAIITLAEGSLDKGKGKDSFASSK